MIVRIARFDPRGFVIAAQPLSLLQARETMR